MKKFVALFLALVVALSLVPAAFAAENCTTNPTTQTNTTDETGRTFESVRVAVTSDGKLAAVKTLKSGYSTFQQYGNEEIEKISSVLKSGGILRAKGLIKGSLDEQNMLADGSTSVQLALEVVNLEELQVAVGDGITLTAVTVMDAASIAHKGHIGHRAVDRPTNLVAKFHQKDGSVLNVYYDVFDGVNKLVFDAEAVAPVQPAPEQPAPQQPAPEQPEPAPEQPAPEQPAPQPNPENDPVVLPWDQAPSTGNTNAGSTQTPSQEQPAPENDPVNLPW